MIESIADLLAAQPFFHGLDAKHIATIAGCGRHTVFKSGDYLLREGDSADYFFVVKSGRVAIQTATPGNAVLRLETLGPGDIIGWSWLFPPHRYSFDAQALEDCRTIALDGRCLREKCEIDHDLGYPLLKRFARIMTDRLSAARLQLQDIYGRPSAARSDAP